MNELKVCPFCGGEARVKAFRTFIEGVHGMGEKYYVSCTQCGVEESHFHYDPESAIEAWNRRTE